MIYSPTRSHDPARSGTRYWDEESTPLFPFGHGLTYGRFAYSGLAVDRASVTADDVVTVSVDVTNTSDREATDVVQLYLHQRHGSAVRPVRELKGFRRVTLAAAPRRVEFALGPDARRYWSTAHRDWVLDDTVFDVWVGGDSTAELATTFTQRRTLP